MMQGDVKELGWAHGIPNRFFIFMGGFLGFILLFTLSLITFGPPIPLFGRIGELPLHPLVVHATVMFSVIACGSTIALATREKWRHKYGHLHLYTLLAMLVNTFIAVESGKVLTELPGLGKTVHADGGTLLLGIMVPFALLSYGMVVMDKHVLRHIDKPSRWQNNLLVAICVLASLTAVLVLVQTVIVGHSGASASWGGTIG
jgi:hypothetical protein